jgi:hypothetical protein
MPHPPAPLRKIVAFARPEVFASHSRPILSRLGYEIEIAEPPEGPLEVPKVADMYVADEHRLGEVPEADSATPSVPVILLTGRRGFAGSDLRVIAAVKKPAGVHDLYRILQQVFEEHPRATPRVATHLRAQCHRKGQNWGAAVVSLSENGCLLRSSEGIPLGSTVNLVFDLPKVGTVQVEAESAYQLLPDTGLVFSAIPHFVRDAINTYVHQALAPAA